MQRSSTVENRQTISGYLSNLYIRHDSAASQYGEVAKAMGDKRELYAFTDSLATYHAKCAVELKSMIDDMPSIPVKPNVEMLDSASNVQASEMDNNVALLKNYQAREEAILDLYTKVLDNDGIPEGQYEQLQNISERTQEVVRKIQRTISSGTIERDMTV